MCQLRSRADLGGELKALAEEFRRLPEEEKAQYSFQPTTRRQEEPQEPEEPEAVYALRVADLLWGLSSSGQPLRPGIAEREAKACCPDAPALRGYTSPLNGARTSFVKGLFVEDQGAK